MELGFLHGKCIPIFYDNETNIYHIMKTSFESYMVFMRFRNQNNNH